MEDELITCYIHWILISYYYVNSWIKSRTGIRLYLLSIGTFTLHPSCQIWKQVILQMVTPNRAENQPTFSHWSARSNSARWSPPGLMLVNNYSKYSSLVASLSTDLFLLYTGPLLGSSAGIFNVLYLFQVMETRVVAIWIHRVTWVLRKVVVQKERCVWEWN